MRCMKRNMVKFFYALYEGREPITDEYGNVTGEYEVKHSNPNEGYANISAAMGETQVQQFGESESYDKVMVIDTDTYPIDEYSVLWIDTEPKVDETGSLMMNEEGNALTPHDYIVKKVAKSLNNVSIAISKVKVSG